MSSRHKRPAPDAATRVLIETVALEAQLPLSTVTRIVEHYLAVLRDQVWERGELRVPEFGMFRVKRHRAKRVRPPGQATVIDIAEREVVVFRASRNWRNR
jgi:nucleoid DNA-binding protein